MKKFLALMMTLAMLLVSASAFGEAYTYTEYNYDETLFTDIGGEWIAMEGLGLMFYLPDIYLSAEIPETLAQIGTVGLFGTADGSSVLNIACGPAVDLNGNALTSVEELAAYYTSVGATNVDIILVNDIPVVTSLLSENDMLGYSVFFEDSTQCILSFTPASDANTALMGGLTITSLMVAEY